ncbi:hypothetical protein PI125_g20908 [Phytophthora idaei]|nr:hypothetical protein PI125_g20908 [Phytophthora idaei]
MYAFKGCPSSFFAFLNACSAKAFRVCLLDTVCGTFQGKQCRQG